MKKKLLVINIFLLLLLLLTNCGNHSSNLEGVNDNNETLNLYKEELCNLLSDYYLSASIDLNIETEYKEMFSSSIIKIKDSKNVIEAKENYNNSISELNNSFPYASGVIDYTNSNDKVNIYKAIEDYLIRNNLTKINILDSEGTTFSLNLNATNKQTWEYLFGENGSVIKTAKENYWEVEPALSNNFFVKALDLAINKNELSKILGLAPDTSTFPAYFRVDLNDTITYLEQTNQVKEYVFDIDEARKYFKLAMYELENQNLYTPGTKENPTVIDLEICLLERELTYIEIIKSNLEEAFNNDDVTDGKYKLNVTYYIPNVWSDIFFNKFYCGQFDLGYGAIGSSTLPRNDEFIRYLSSDDDISLGYTLNWSVNTNDASTACIIYQNKKYSFDALYMALHEKVSVDDGNLTDPCKFNMLDYKSNGDLSYTASISLSLLDNFDIDIEDVVIFYTDYSSYDDYYEESILENSNISYNNIENVINITITIPKEIYEKYKGMFAFDIYYKITYQDELFEQTYKTIEPFTQNHN